MREIKFRGKRIDNGEWVIGNYVRDDRDGVHWICYYWEDGERAYQVDPSTVGQYTGLKDRNGKEIYEEDKITGKTLSLLINEIYSIDVEIPLIYKQLGSMTNIEIIGNIHDEKTNN